MNSGKPSTSKWIVAILIIGAIALISWAIWQQRGRQSTETPFRIGMVTFVGYAPLYLAQEQGYYDGLPVELNRIEDVPSIRAGMESGALDAYLATFDIALDTNQNPPGVAVWALDESSGGDGVVVAEGINTLSDLKGKRVAAEPGLPPNFVMLYLLHQNGLSLADIQFQDMTTQNAATAFASRAVDAAGLYEPYLSTAKAQRPNSRVALSSAETPGLIVDFLFVRKDVLEGRMDHVRKVVSGWRRAVKRIEDAPEPSYESMAKAFGLPVGEFKETAGGVKWLGLTENAALFGRPDNPGRVYANFDLVVEVLRRHRPGVYKSRADEHISRAVIDTLE